MIMSEGRDRAKVAVAFRERKTGKVIRGEPWEQHADTRRRLDLGERTAGWLEDGFVDLVTGEFLSRGQAARRWPGEAGRTRGFGVADSSDFECIREAKLRRLAEASGQHGGSRL
jgi:hypothetical protein